MKHFFIACLLLLTLLMGCGEKSGECPYYFAEAFPKRAINLTNVLGEKITLHTYMGDTLVLTISYNRKFKLNTIQYAKTGDTLFHGRASRYKGIIFLSNQHALDQWYISAFRKKGNLIWGLTDQWTQMFFLQSMFCEDSLHANADFASLRIDSSFQLKADKKGIYRIYAQSIIDHQADTIWLASSDAGKEKIYDAEDLLAEAEDGESTALKSYPNPLQQELTIETKPNFSYTAEFINLKGEVVEKKTFIHPANKVDVSNISPGTYILRITDSAYNVSVSRVIKE